MDDRSPNIEASRSDGEFSPTGEGRNRLGHDLFTIAKEHGDAYRRPQTYEDIKVPRNNAMGVTSGLVAGALLGFGLTWQIWWLVILAALAGVAAIVWYGIARIKEKIFAARAVAQETARWLGIVEASIAAQRTPKNTPANQNFAEHNAQLGIRTRT